MSSELATTAPPSSGFQPHRMVDVESYIDRRIEETRRHVRGVDLTVALLRLAIGVLAYLLLAMVLDHWVLAGGLGRGWRFLLWAVLVLTAGGYCARYVVPLLIHRINPIYAAQTIERTRPTFKNGLINFLLLRREAAAIQNDELAKRVYQGLQVHTASELSRVTVGTTVDRLQVIRLGYLLASLVAVGCLYFVLSPKNPLVSFGRVIFPWARIGVPTRVSIEGITPGDAVAYQGDHVMVSAEVHGLRAGEPVNLYYSSVDGHRVDQAVPMRVPEGGFRHQGELPPGSAGLQHSLLYWIAAGDAKSPTFRIDVQIPPAIVVDRVEYDYPAYTGLPQRVAVREGDLRAIEGTRVTIHGAANFPIAQARIELEGDSRPTLPMTADGSTAIGRLTLAMSREDPSRPEYRWYQLRFTDPEGRENRRPIRHRIEVIPDQKPQVRFLDPPPDGTQLPVNGALELKVRAEDPDFGLRRVELRAERANRSLLIPPLLKKPRPEKPHQGPLEATYLFQPKRLDLKPGDRVAYWVEAADCKEKAEDPGFQGNVAETERRTLLIVAEDPTTPEQSRAKQGAGAKSAGQQPSDAAQKPDDGMTPEEKPAQPGDAAQATKGDQDSPAQGSKPQPSKTRSPSSSPDAKPEDSGDPSHDDSQPGPGQPKSGGNVGGKAEGKTGKTDDQSKVAQSSKPSDADEMSNADSAESANSQGANSQGRGAPSGAQGRTTESADRQQDQQPAPIDGDTNPGEAFERILEDQRRQQSQARSAAQGNQSDSSQMPSDQQPEAARAANEKPSSGQQEAEGPQSAARPKKGEEDKPPDGQPPSGQESSDARSEPNTRKGQSSPKAAQPKPSGSEAGSEDQPTDRQNAQATQEGIQAAKGDRSPSGGAGEKKATAPAEKPDGQSRKSEDASARGETAKNGPQGDKTAKTPRNQDHPPEGPESEKPDEQGKAGSDASGDKSDKGAKEDQVGQGAMNQGSDAEPKAGQTDPQAKSGAKTPPSKGNEESKGGPRSTEQGQSGDSRRGGKRDETSSDASQPQAPQGSDSASRPEAPGADRTEDGKSPMPSESSNPAANRQDAGDGQRKDASKGGDEAPSPSISPKPSTAKSDSEGDRSADGKTGGGQQSKQSGQGTPGSQTPADQGKEGAQEKGEGEVGNKPGEQSMSEQASGKSAEQGQGRGEGSGKTSAGAEVGKRPPPGDPSRQKAEGAKSGPPQQEAPAGKNPSQKGGSTLGNPTEGGGEPGEATTGEPPAAPPLPPPDDPNLEYARKQTTLALEHLADQLDKDRSELLERLGWDRAYAENFLRQWKQMLQAANQPGPQGEAAKRELDKALKSLGLRPTRSEVQKAKTPADNLQQLQDSGRIPPPVEWRDYFKAYTEGVAGNKE